MVSRLPRLAVLVGAGLVCAARLHALDPAQDISQYSLDAWSTREGLPQSSVQAVLQTGRPQTAGPYTDEYGVFVSAFAPVPAPRSTAR